MINCIKIPSVLHGDNEDLNHTLAHLSWKEFAIGFGIAIAVFLIVLLIGIGLE